MFLTTLEKYADFRKQYTTSTASDSPMTYVHTYLHIANVLNGFLAFKYLPINALNMPITRSWWCRVLYIQ